MNNSEIWTLLAAIKNGDRTKVDEVITCVQKMDQQIAEQQSLIDSYQQDLEKKQQLLNSSLKDLHRIQEHLLQTEKLSMLGQMVSGISHEINNPINFIYGNLPYVEEHVSDLLEVIETYQSTYPEAPDEIQDLLEEVDIEFIQSDLPRIVTSLKVGAERIRDLVLNLRHFYRLDEAEMKPADINSGLESTLVLLNNRYKQKIEVVREYGELPQVECHINQLNQVFMNLIGNAIDALIDESKPVEPGARKPQISIATKRLGENWIVIEVADNGPGISESIQPHLFEPFFTTKPIGMGTGLGLSISQQIVVDTHGGKLYCHSKLGMGATFTVELPIQQGQKESVEELSQVNG